MKVGNGHRLRIDSRYFAICILVVGRGGKYSFLFTIAFLIE